MEIEPSKTTLALTSCRSAEDIARALTFQNVSRRQLRQLTFADVPYIDLPANPTNYDLIKFYHRSDKRFDRVSSLTIAGKLDNGTVRQVPVTPAMTAEVEDLTHHIVALDQDNGDRLEFLIEECSGYVKAFRPILATDDRASIQWRTFSQKPLPKRFGVPIRVKYGESYSYIDRVRLGEGYFDEMVDFMFTFRHNPYQARTKEGAIYFDSAFVFIAEGRRFRMVRKWTVAFVGACHHEPLPAPFGLVITDYSCLCKCSFMLLLAYLEEGLLCGNFVPEAEKAGHPLLGSMDKAKVEWQRRQEVLQSSELRFYSDDSPMNLDSLVGGELLLLRHDYDLCNKILMRSQGYDGHWMAAISIGLTDLPQDDD